MSLAQILTIAIFVLMFAAIIWGKVHRYIPALVGGGLVLVVFLAVMQQPHLVVTVLNLGQLIQGRFWFPGHEPITSHGINWQTIIFIAGMMVMVEGLARVGFFRWICLLVARLSGYRVVPVLVAFMVLSAFLSMFIDSITVMLFLASVTIELARLLEFDPVPVIIAEIFAANTGGSATMAGDPPNIIIGTSLGYSFIDFMVNTGLIAWTGMVVAIVFFYFATRRTLGTHRQSQPDSSLYPRCRSAITRMPAFLAHSAVFLLVVVLLATHAQTGISVALVGVIAALLTIVVAASQMRQTIARLDWRTLLFFVGLFVAVGGLEETGVLAKLAEVIGQISGGSLPVIVTIILWFSAFASAIVDNIPFAATMVPVIVNLSQSLHLNLHPMAWSLALGTDIGGNGTPIGASANVVGTAIAEREGYKVGWGRYLMYGIPATLLVVGLCNLLLLLRY